MPKSTTSAPHRLFPWTILALIVTVALIFMAHQNIPQYLGKLVSIPTGLVLGVLAFETLLPYARPSAYLSEPWHLCMVFQNGEPDFKIVPGKETVFLVCCVLKVLSMFAGAYVFGLGN